MRIVPAASCLALTLALSGSACAPEEDQRTGSMTDERARSAREALPAEVLSRIDSGNAAYREGRYEEAAAVYRRIVEADPDVAAGWFGLYMAERALGNQDAAEEALERAESLSSRSGG